MKRIMARQPLTPGEVAALFGVDAKTVTRWAKRGRLPSFRTPGGHRRYRVADVEAILNSGDAYERLSTQAQPKIAVIPVRDIREGDVIDLDGQSAEVVHREPTETSPDYLCIDWRAPGDNPAKPAHRHSIRALTATVPLLRRPIPTEDGAVTAWLGPHPSESPEATS